MDQTYCCIGKFNTALSLCGVLEITLYFSEGFSEVTARVSAVTEASWPLKVTTVCFLEEKSTCGVFSYFLRAVNGDNLEEVLANETVRNVFALF